MVQIGSGGFLAALEGWVCRQHNDEWVLSSDQLELFERLDRSRPISILQSFTSLS